MLIEKQRVTLKKLKTQLKKTKKKQQEEATEGNSYRFKHISEMDQDNRLLGTKGYRLKLRLNGNVDLEAIVVYFSNKDLQKGKKTKEDVMQSFFNMLNSNEGLKESFIGHGRRSVFRRAFLVNGAEVKEVDDIGNDAEVWLSFGEDFVPMECKENYFSSVFCCFKGIFCIKKVKHFWAQR